MKTSVSIMYCMYRSIIGYLLNMYIHELLNQSMVKQQYKTPFIILLLQFFINYISMADPRNDVCEALLCVADSINTILNSCFQLCNVSRFNTSSINNYYHNIMCIKIVVISHRMLDHKRICVSLICIVLLQDKNQQ